MLLIEILLPPQVVPHVHFHVIPKPNKDQGLGIDWPAEVVSKETLKSYYDKVIERLEEDGVKGVTSKETAAL